MAKKGGVQLLQADITTDDEFEKFIERSGLLVMDVYTEWCGPCLAMVGSLKKIKLELGGDNLQLAICKSDTIEVLSRFREKSEPTWLFASHGKVVNIMFGTNVPKLMKLITEELDIELSYQNGTAKRTFYEIAEPLPIEVERMEVIRDAKEAAERIEKEAADKKRRAYITQVTDQIAMNLPDIGITIFGPHISRDIFKKLIDPADSLNLSCKDRKVTQIAPEALEILHFDCPNPINDEALEYIFNKEVLICLWKISDNEIRTVEEVLQDFVIAITRPHPIKDEFGNENPDVALPPIMQTLEIPRIKIRSITPTNELLIEKSTKKESIKADSLANTLEDFEIPNLTKETDREDGNEDVKDTGERDEEADETKTEISKTESSITDLGKISIPAIWSPGNKRTTAGAIYLFYRMHTEHFLPPDPVPEPEHLAIAFDAYKRKDIIEVFDQYKDAILAYGYFTNDEPETAKLIANSTKKYETIPQNVTDKLVIKVAKVTSHALLALAAQGPCYVSLNTVDGHAECLLFFPEGYKTGEMEEAEAAIIKATAAKKKKKKKKKVEEGTESVGTVVSEADPEDANDLEGDEDGNGDDAVDDSKEDGDGAEDLL